MAIGIAHGLSYLHLDCIPAIIHRDIKSKNILLDLEMDPHITDFGIARFMDKYSVSTTSLGVMGTVCFMARETAFTTKRSNESDVYSFGVVLLELITRKTALDPSYSENSDLVSWARSSLDGGDGVGGIVDPDLMDEVLGTEAEEEVRQVVTLAFRCTEKDPGERPSMRQVVMRLTDIKSSEIASRKPKMKEEADDSPEIQGGV
ncbi:Leucine-rich repeat receptor-like protein kinase PEPR2 [Platanthera guangdongensis]|uniref:Leucine-rich repeat receptor-like protein kinase PEPR2 n=1 Tax=Platanthera guangdongensis TaxID=2320717 RepID=A0ABR2MWR4_9ASPA